MAKLTNLIAKFQSAVDAHANVKSLVYGYLWDLNTDRTKEYPAVVLIPPNSNISNYSAGVEAYRIELWVVNPYKLDEQATRQASWEELKDWAWDIIDAVIDRETYRLGNNKQISTTLFPPEAVGAAKVIAVKFDFTIDVVDCRNM